MRCVAIIFFALIFGEFKYNPYTHNLENCSKESTLTYNVYTKSWSYEDLGSGYKYNPYEKKFDIANDKAVLKYNSKTDKWEYAPINSKLNYNNNHNKWYWGE